MPTSNEPGGTVVVLPLADDTMTADIAGLAVNQIQFTNAQPATLTLTTPLNIASLAGLDSVLNPQGTHTIRGSSLNLSGLCNFTVVTGELKIESQLTGSGGLRKDGQFYLTLSSTLPSTYQGPTIIHRGICNLDTQTSDSGVSKTIVIGDEGTIDQALLVVRNDYELPDDANVTINLLGNLIIADGILEDFTTLKMAGGTIVIDPNARFTLRSGGTVSLQAEPLGFIGTIVGKGTFEIASTVTFDVPISALSIPFRLTTNVVSGSPGAALIKTGPGRMSLSYFGTIKTDSLIVRDGELYLDSDISSAVSSPIVIVGDSLGAPGSAIVRLAQDNQISTTTSVDLRSDGLLDLLHRWNTVSDLTVRGGSFITTANGLLTTNRLTHQATRTNEPSILIDYLRTVGDQLFQIEKGTPAVDLLVAAKLIAGGVVKDGEGVMVLTANNTYAGPTIIRAGILEINGSQPTNDVSITGGVLAGRGTIGNLTGTGGSVVLRSGGSPASLIAKNVSLGSTSLYVDLAGPLSFGQLHVKGTLDVTGSTLVLDSSFATPAGSMFTVIDNDDTDPVIGTFTGLPEGAEFGAHDRTFRISYIGGDGNDVVLTDVVPGGNQTPSLSTIPPQASYGTVIGPIAWTVGDAETTAANLTVTARSSNPAVIPDQNIELSGNGANRTIRLTPNGGPPGIAFITITVQDDQGAFATETFSVQFDDPQFVPPDSLTGSRELTVGSDTGSNTLTHVNPDGSVRFTLQPFKNFTGGLRTASGDFTGDGVADVVVGTGPGTATHVKVFDGVSKAELFSLDPFEAAFTGGVYVAAGDINGDGVADLAITPDEGGGPRVRVFTGAGFTQIADFFGIDDQAFRGGARPAIGDLNGDGIGDLVVAAGFGGGPRVAAFDGTQLKSNGGPKLFGDFFAFEQALRNGIFVAAGDVNGDGFADLVAGGGPGGGPRVYILDGKSLVQNGSTTLIALGNFFAGDQANRGGIRVAVKDLDNDAKADVVTGAGSGAGSRVTAYLGASITPTGGTPTPTLNFDAFPGFAGGVFVG